MPDSTKLTRKFFNNNTIQDIVNFVRKHANKGYNQVSLKKVYPSKYFEVMSNNLKDEGFGKQE